MMLRLIYLALAIWGAAHPMTLFLRYMAESDTGLVAAWFANAASSGLMWDIIIASTALVVWILSEVRVRRNFEALLAIPAIFAFGPGCGLPLYLFLRTRPLT